MKSIIWRLFFCDWRAESVLFRAECRICRFGLGSPSSLVRETFFYVYPLLKSARGYLSRFWMAESRISGRNQLCNDQKLLQYRSCSNELEKLDDNYSNSWRNWDNLTFLLRRGTSGNETVYPANLQFIIVSEKQCLLWHKNLMSGAEWSKLTSPVW